MVIMKEVDELKKEGYGLRQIEAILESKWVRWARDSGMTIVEFINANPEECSRENVRLLTRGKF